MIHLTGIGYSSADVDDDILMDERYGKTRRARRRGGQCRPRLRRGESSLTHERVLDVRNICMRSLRAFSVRPRLHRTTTTTVSSLDRRFLASSTSAAPPRRHHPSVVVFVSLFPPPSPRASPARSAASVASSAFATSHNPSLANTNVCPVPASTARLTCGSATSPGSSRLRNPSPSVRVRPDPRARVASGGNGAPRAASIRSRSSRSVSSCAREERAIRRPVRILPGTPRSPRRSPPAQIGPSRHTATPASPPPRPSYSHPIVSSVSRNAPRAPPPRPRARGRFRRDAAPPPRGRWLARARRLVPRVVGTANNATRDSQRRLHQPRSSMRGGRPGLARTPERNAAVCVGCVRLGIFSPPTPTRIFGDSIVLE